MIFMKEKENSFRFNYLIFGCIIKEKKEVIWDHNLQRQRQIDVLMIFHKYDTQPLLLSPQIDELLNVDEEEETKYLEVFGE